MDWIKQPFRYLSRVIQWLIEPRIVWMCLLVLAAAILIPFYTWKTEFSIRLSGYLLEMFGLGLTLFGLVKIRSHFQLDSIKTLLSSWLARFPKWRGNVVLGVGSARSKSFVSNAFFSVWSPDDKTAPLEERVDKIITNIERLRDTQSQNRQKIGAIESDVTELKKSEAKAREEMEKKIKEDMESVHAGGIFESMAGLVWLAGGLTLSTLSEELSRWLH
ncbi:MAG: hypothetical protein ABW162_15960 [Candidatus Sedimenticola sp. PURPLELP]